MGYAAADPRIAAGTEVENTPAAGNGGGMQTTSQSHKSGDSPPRVCLAERLGISKETLLLWRREHTARFDANSITAGSVSLYNLFPNGHLVRNVRIDGDKMIATGTDGKQIVKSKRELMIMAQAYSEIAEAFDLARDQEHKLLYDKLIEKALAGDQAGAQINMLPRQAGNFAASRPGQRNQANGVGCRWPDLRAKGPAMQRVLHLGVEAVAVGDPRVVRLELAPVAPDEGADVLDLAGC